MGNKQSHVSIIICTYNRRISVINNIEILNNKCKDFVYRVYVVDNASNLPTSLNNSFVKIISNKNLGGSGGYARGMYEAQKDKTCTHILLMDDDIQFDEKTLKQAVEKLASINSEDWFALGMRTFENQDRLFENTAYWSGVVRKSNNKNCPLMNTNIKENKYNYAAWWSLIMPISVIDKYGYPMPFFIKSDDIEYGMRRKHERICYDNSIAILHEDFSKKFSKPIIYYNIRNYLATNILHFKHSLIKSILMFTLRSGKAWLTFSFAKLELSLLGFKDFLNGPRFFKETDLEKNNIKISETASQIKFNFCKFLAYPFIVIYYLLLFLFRHHKLKQEYLSEFKYLTSKEYWEKQFFN